MRYISEAVDKYRELILSAERYIWQNPETGFKEFKTSKYMEEQFENLGYEITRAEGITGFYTTVDTGRPGPTVLALAELDAVICKSHPEADPETGAVHACGHNAQCAAMLGVAAALKDDKEMQIVAGVDKFNNSQSFPVFKSFSEVNVPCDLIIDFSHPTLLDDLLGFATEKNIPVVIATTGYDEGQIKQIHNASAKIPVFFTFNMSLGVNLICSLAKKAASILGDGFDVEIVEKHHNQKIDAPSGTAIMLANSINEIFDDTKTYEYDRHSKRQKRTKNEIGIHSVRGGTIVGEHDVIFAGHDEVVTISHSAFSKEVFAVGAVKAARFIYGKAAGLYDMNSIMSFE